MLTAATCEEALAASAHVADASKACAELIETLGRRRLSEKNANSAIPKRIAHK